MLFLPEAGRFFVALQGVPYRVILPWTTSLRLGARSLGKGVQQPLLDVQGDIVAVVIHHQHMRVA